MSIKVYAALAFLSAAWALWRAGQMVVAGLAAHHAIRLVFELLWAAFNFALALGILRLRPAWRIIALVCCAWVFAISALMLVAWCISPHSVAWPVMLISLVEVAINGFFFYRFRQPDIRSLFHADSAATPSV
jgi:hypothetical protein